MNVRKTRAGRWPLVVGVLALACGLGEFVVQKTSVAQTPAATPSELKTDKTSARALSQIFRDASEKILPAVVTIETSSNPAAAQTQRQRPGREMPDMEGENPFKGTPFEDFFRQNPDMGKQFRFHGDAPKRRHEGTGSGVIIDKSGLILTNNHVVEGADEIKVRLADGREFKATDVRTDSQSDLAVLRIKNADNLPFAKLGDSSKMEIGDWVIAVGNPFGLDSTVSAGIISGKGRELGGGQRTRYLQTDAAINPGNSGGPLVNLDGEVVGINTAIATNSGGYQGIGFAIPINQAKWVANQLVESGAVQRAYLGVSIAPVSGDLAQKFGVERGHGVLVNEVFPNSPASAAGFKDGDVITTFAGTKVNGPRELQELVERAELGTKQDVSVLRDGKTVNLQVTVKQLPKDFGKMARTEEPKEPEQANGESFVAKELGLEVTNMTPEQAKTLGFENRKGVLVSEVTAGGLAEAAGLHEGMLIVKVGKQGVENVDQFKEAVAKQDLKEGVLLLVRTEQGNRFIVLQHAQE
jgi:serine protease Do